jgi:hypothetical protein
MQDTPKEAATGDKAARDLTLSELLQVCTQESWQHSSTGCIYASDKQNGNNIFYAIVQKESRHCNDVEITANAKLMAMSKTIAAELIKERAVNAKLLEALKMTMKAADWMIEPPKDSYGSHAYATAITAIKQAEEL